MSNDVLITPASRKIEFKDSSANIDAVIETDASGNLNITNAGGDIQIGDTATDVYIGNGVANVDIIYEQSGEIRAVAGQTLTLGGTGSLSLGSDLNINSKSLTGTGSLSIGAATFTSDSNALTIRTASNGVGAEIRFSDQIAATLQFGYLTYFHSDTASYGSGNAFIFGSSEATTTILADGKLMYGEGLYLKPATGTGAGTRKDLNWDTAYTYSQVGHVELDGTSTITGSSASNGTRTAMVWMRGKAGDSVNQINVRGPDIEFGQGGTLDATPAFKFGHTGILTATGQINASGGNSGQWNTAYGWGDHAGTYLPLAGGTLTGTLNTKTVNIKAEGLGSNGITSQALQLSNPNDSAYTASGLSAYNATTSWDISDKVTFSASSRPKAGSIYTYINEHSTSPVAYERFVQLSSTANNLVGMRDMIFYQYDGTGTATTDMKKPVGNLITVRTYNVGNTPTVFALDSDGDLTLSGTVTASGGNSGQWNTAYGWGDHSTAGYASGSFLPLSGGTLSGSLTLEKTGTATVSDQAYNSQPLYFQASGWDTNNAIARTLSWTIKNEPTASVYPDFDLTFSEDTATIFKLHGRGTSGHVDGRSGTFFGNLHVEAGAGTGAGNGSLNVAGTVTASGGNSGQWNTAHGWGNHASAGYITSSTATFDSLRIASGGTTSDVQEGKEYKYYLVGASTVDGNWKKVCDVTIATGLYKALAMNITLESQDSNFGSVNTTQTSKFSATYYRSGGAQNDANNATLSGQDTTNHALRILKTATGAYELQIKMLTNYRDAIVKIEVLSTNGGTVSVPSSIVNGSTTGTAYTPSTSTSVKTLYNEINAGTITGGNSANWNTAHGWGNHASAGYITGVTAGTGLSGGATSGSATLNIDWKTNENFTGTYPVVWNANNDPYTVSWFTVNGSTDTVTAPNLAATEIAYAQNIGHAQQDILFAITDHDTTESIRNKFEVSSQVSKVDDSTAPASGIFEVTGAMSKVFGPYIPISDDTEIMFETWVKYVSGGDASGDLYAGGNFYNGSKTDLGNNNRYWGANGDNFDSNDPAPAGEWHHIKGILKGSSIRGISSTSTAEYVRLLVLLNYNANDNTTRYCGFKFYQGRQLVSSLYHKRHNTTDAYSDTGFTQTYGSSPASFGAYEVLDSSGALKNIRTITSHSIDANYAGDFTGAPQPQGAAGQQSNGLYIKAGSSSNDNSFKIDNLAGSQIAKINGFGQLTLAGTISASGYNSGNWNTAYGWGDHSTAGYLTSSGFLPLTGGTLTGKLTLNDAGYSLGNEYHKWKRAYTVNTSSPQEILYSDGNSLPTGGVYRFTAHISATGTDQFATAVYWNQNGTWRINVTGQSGTNSNHPEFIIDATTNKPTIHIDHASSYGIHILGERIELDEGTGNDNAGYAFGTDAFLGSVNNNLYFLPGGTAATGQNSYDDGNVVWHTGNLTTTNKSNYDTAYGWGNHASAGYLTSGSFLPLSGGTMTGKLTTNTGIEIFYNDHASGPVWDTFVHIGKVDDASHHGNLGPVYQPDGSYGMLVQANSDGMFVGLEQTTTGNYNPVIKWGDDHTSGEDLFFRHADDTYVAKMTYNSFTVDGTISATGGSSTNWNTAYTYSQVGHLPLAGGTLTGNTSLETATNPTITIKNTDTTIVADQVIGTVEFRGADDSGNVLAGHIQQVSTGAWGVANYGSDMVFSIKVGGTGGAFTEKLRLGYDGAEITKSLKVAGIAPTNSAPATDEVELSGYGLIGNRGNVYITNSNANGQIVMGISGAHNANARLTVTTSGITVGGTVAANGTVSATGGNSTNWNTAYGWGDHSTAGYQTSAYSLPLATSTARGGIELFSDTVQTMGAVAVTSTTGRTYGVQLNSAGQAVVNVPWTGGSSGSFLPLTGGTLTGDLTIPSKIIHSGDSNTYMQFHAADQWRVVTGGTERLEVNNTAMTSTLTITAPAYKVAAGGATITRDPGNTVGSLWLSLGVTDKSFAVSDGNVSRFVISGASGGVTGSGTIESKRQHIFDPVLATTSDATATMISKGSVDTTTGYQPQNWHMAFQDGGGTVRGKITSSHYATQYSTSSDYRLKEDIQPIANATARLLAIEAVNFRWIDGQQRSDGFIAHELQEHLPEAVTGEKDATEEITETVVAEDGTESEVTRTIPALQGVDQSKLVPLLVKTIQELEARITALENA